MDYSNALKSFDVVLSRESLEQPVRHLAFNENYKGLEVSIGNDQAAFRTTGIFKRIC